MQDANPSGDSLPSAGHQPTVLVSSGCRDKLSQTWWFQVTQIFSCNLEARNPTWNGPRVARATNSPQSSKGESGSLPFPKASKAAAALLGAWPLLPPSNPAAWHLASVVPGCLLSCQPLLCFSLIRTLVIAFRSYHIIQDDLKILNLITSAKSMISIPPVPLPCCHVNSIHGSQGPGPDGFGG